MVTSKEWPRPSESRRVRRLFYLADGLLFGGFFALLVGIVSVAVLVFIEPDSNGVKFSFVGVVGLIVFLFFIFRGLGFRILARRMSREQPPERQDWADTRQRHRIAVVTLIVGGLLLAGLVTLSGWRHIITFRASVLLITGVIFIGLLLRLYLFHRLGLRVI